MTTKGKTDTRREIEALAAKLAELVTRNGDWDSVSATGAVCSMGSAGRKELMVIRANLGAEDKIVIHVPRG